MAPLLMSLAACSASQQDGVTDVAIIGTEQGMFTEGLRLPFEAQHLRAATRQGLVALDEQGQVVPAIAERWIVTDDGQSYIFRIREFDFADGTRLTAQSVRASLSRTLGLLEDTTMGLDLANIRDVRAMTGRVVEIRLHSPMPDLLQLLAQPEMGLALGEAEVGPMRLTRDGAAAELTPLRPEQRGLPEQPDWDETVHPLRIYAVDARNATDGFSSGRYDLVLNGRLVDLPLADIGALARGTIRLDATKGLFGLDVLRASGFLSVPANREALAMALDRAALIEPFNIGGWIPTTRVVAPGLANDDGSVPERWIALTIEERRAEAMQRVAAWEAQNDAEVSLRLALPEGPGSDILFDALVEQYGEIGVALERVEMGDKADLALRDRVARYAGARWFLNQFNCAVSRALCSPDVDFVVGLAAESRDPAEQASYLAEAETALAAVNGYIPIGAPIRWSLARAGVAGFSENPWNFHPLFPLSRAPM
ncbi:peptide ABC transporter substrate-binding protein [Erythrobacter sp. QSSC1-22B]|uniref:ABC transporter substrate-binding protein n=1 Tax=Erythrobacter sp. QSSC1-22B TaxID=1860125 RepID=UPI000804CAD2|nr:ABC transporter substrate-binding protein [Erythrobacter sp. QSSC1-22B]OBX19830.1 peptide ABC transporter substrate-binding protein [Erythrobacter sp. QSSC1-22B]